MSRGQMRATQQHSFLAAPGSKQKCRFKCGWPVLAARMLSLHLPLRPTAASSAARRRWHPKPGRGGWQTPNRAPADLSLAADSDWWTVGSPIPDGTKSSRSRTPVTSKLSMSSNGSFSRVHTDWDIFCIKASLPQCTSSDLAWRLATTAPAISRGARPSSACDIWGIRVIERRHMYPTSRSPKRNLIAMASNLYQQWPP